MLTITSLFARQVLDSRGVPTLEVVCLLSDGSLGVGSVPSGSSTGSGSYEAQELRDGDANHFWGMGVTKAIVNVNSIISAKLLGVEVKNVNEIDSTLISLDATPNKSSLGSNAILGVSIAVAKAIAASRHVPLYRYLAAIAHNDQSLFIPTPIFSMINGGLHGAGNLDFQAFHIIPAQKSAFSRHLEMGATIYHSLKNILARRGSIHSIGDEGGFAPNLFTNLDTFEILKESITSCELTPYKDIEFGLDIAANSFYKDSRYHIKDRSSPLESAEFSQYLIELSKQYPLRLLEDPLQEDDWEGWARLTAAIGTSTFVVGDNLLVTSEARVQTGISQKSCSAVLIKPNQIGTITETINVIKLARSAGWKVIVSHRSGETNDTFIADFAVGVGADFVKFGAPARGERVAKYNRLLAIETELVGTPK